MDVNRSTTVGGDFGRSDWRARCVGYRASYGANYGAWFW